MRLLMAIILGVLLVTYAWGWLIHVSAGSMDTRRYTRYYLREVSDQIDFILEETEKAVDFAKKPLMRPKAFE